MKRWIAPLVLAVLCANLRGNAQKASASPAQLAQSHITRAKQLLAEHDFERGKSEIDEAIKIDPNSSEAYQLLGQISLQNGRVPEAVSAFERALKLKPDSFSAHYGLGMARLREQNIEAGIRELRTAVSLRPSDIDANYNLGVLLLDPGGTGLRQTRRSPRSRNEGCDVSGSGPHLAGSSRATVSRITSARRRNCIPGEGAGSGARRC